MWQDVSFSFPALIYQLCLPLTPCVHHGSVQEEGFSLRLLLPRRNGQPRGHRQMVGEAGQLGDKAELLDVLQKKRPGIKSVPSVLEHKDKHTTTQEQASKYTHTKTQTHFYVPTHTHTNMQVHLYDVRLVAKVLFVCKKFRTCIKRFVSVKNILHLLKKMIHPS